MWRILLLVLFFMGSITSNGYSQTRIDSIRNQLQYMPADTNKVEAMLKIVSYFRMRNMEDSLLRYTRQVIDLSDEINYPSGHLSAVLAEGLIQHAKGNFKTSIAKNHEALTLAKKHNLKRNEGLVYHNMAMSFTRSGLYDSSFYYYTLADKTLTANQQFDELWRVYNGMALLYSERNEIDKAGEYLEKAYELIKDSDNRMSKGYIIYKAAEFFFYTDNYDKYLKYAELWDAFQNEKKTTKDLVESPEHSSLSFLFTDEDEVTIQRLEKAAKYFENLGNMKRKAWSMEDMARVYRRNGEIVKATSLAEDAAEIYSSLDEKLRLLQVKWLLYELYDEQKQYREALTSFKDVKTLIDSIQTFEREQLLADLEVRYETDKKEQALKIQDLEIRQKTQQRNILLGSSIFLGLLAVLIFFGLRQRIITNKELATQRSEIQAQKIQQLEQEKQLLAFSSMIEGQESERIRIAKDLHDGIGGLLTTAKAHFNAIQDQVKKLEELNLVHKTNELIDEACVEVRRISQNMMPRALMLHGLSGAIEDLATNLKQNNINCNLEIVGMDKDPEQSKSVMIFRVLQELVNNILKHANAKNVLIQLLQADNGLSIIVEDDGVGFNYATAKQKKSLGLSSIESRIKYLQGNLDFDAVPGEGTTIAIWVPLDK
jgi:signal transduction histidine kinase